MKKTLIALGLIIFYTALYVVSHMFGNWAWLIFLLFLILPSLISISFFNNKKYSISFILSGIYVFALIFIIGTDYSKLLNIDLNGFLGIFYMVFVVVLIVAGLITGLVELIMLSMKKTNQ